ncbi:MAG: hypothetical protein U1F70_05385 [Candidatus Competibacteraceae bacterium]
MFSERIDSPDQFLDPGAFALTQKPTSFPSPAVCRPAGRCRWIWSIYRLTSTAPPTARPELRTVIAAQLAGSSACAKPS